MLTNNPRKNSQVISDIERAISEDQMNQKEAIAYIQALYKRGLIADTERRSLVKYAYKWTGNWVNPGDLLQPNVLTHNPQSRILQTALRRVRQERARGHKPHLHYTETGDPLSLQRAETSERRVHDIVAQYTDKLTRDELESLQNIAYAEDRLNPGDILQPHVRFDYPRASFGQSVSFENPYPHKNPQWLIGSVLALAALYMFGRR